MNWLAVLPPQPGSPVSVSYVRFASAQAATYR